ncbi:MULTISPECIES: LLM class flavin-dependent oxidoreductase [Frankia]|uniref:5,10-methylenetetrahydromethanopterin reductase n=1 Tax=Frankia alni (strain DSM 45986 / CECT 9034 / ACN14a) TaxID=326424 RepID=Q0RAK3_FRAAA|nr:MULTISPECIES: LLM class flavin-dependent oxidoreductase [Frankia]CAL29843.1 putative 5,10-methylenetetrahydromethanopterin reductase [Frankia alni ACN14a]
MDDDSCTTDDRQPNDARQPTGIRLGVLVPVGKAQWGAGTDPRELVDFAVRAEELGYDSLWVNDSLLGPRIEALTMLAAVAPVTHRVTLGTATLLPVLRRPVQAAQTLASLDLLSGGRLTVAVGAAFPGRFGRPLHDLSAVPWADRFARLDETVALWRRLWTADGPTSFHGDVLHVDDIPPATAPSQAGGPPIWLGGAAPAALIRAGRRYDGWLPYPPDRADYRSGLAQVRAAAADAGRGPNTITPALFASVLIADSVASGRDTLAAYSQANYGLGLRELEAIQAVITGPAAQVVARLAGYIAAGARHLVCRLGTVDLGAARDQLERLADILPLLRRAAGGSGSGEGGGEGGAGVDEGRRGPAGEVVAHARRGA